jgi:hypothetical protein
MMNGFRISSNCVRSLHRCLPKFEFGFFAVFRFRNIDLQPVPFW